MTNNLSNNDDFSIAGISWSNIQGALSKEPHKQIEAKFQRSMYTFAADESNEDKLIEAVSKTLERTNPENATYKQAVVVAKQVQAFARKRLEEMEAATGKK